MSGRGVGREGVNTTQDEAKRRVYRKIVEYRKQICNKKKGKDDKNKHEEIGKEIQQCVKGM